MAKYSIHWVSSSSGSQNSEMGLSWLNQGVSRTTCHCKGSRGQSISLCFLAARSLPHSLACGLSLLQIQQSPISLNLFLLSHLSLTATGKNLHLSRTHVIRLSSTWITQDNDSISRSLALITSAKSLCHVIAYSQVSAIRMWESFGGTSLLPFTLYIKLSNIGCGPIF